MTDKVLSMNPLPPVYTDPAAQCNDCHLCIGLCPVKAIAMEESRASILPRECVGCGQCVQACPKLYQRVRPDFEIIQTLINAGKPIIVSLSTAWVSEFPGISYSVLYRALQRLGLREISGVSLGAQLFTEEIARTLPAMPPGVYILPACPAVNTIITKAWPHWTESILPVASPLITHARLLKQIYGNDVSIVAIGPCIAHKVEADAAPDLIAATLTFAELRNWMLDSGINLTAIAQEAQFAPVPGLIPTPATAGHRWVSAGGLAKEISALIPNAEKATLDILHYSGPEAIREALTGLETWGKRSTLLLELMFCGGGCVNGPGASHHNPLPLRQLTIKRYAKQSRKRKSVELPTLDMAWTYHKLADEVCELFSVEQIALQLDKIGLDTREQLPDCGICGYPTCKAFAIALCQKKAETHMCTPYQRAIANLKFHAVLNNMPSGVAIVSSALRVLEANWNMALLLGHKARIEFDKNPGLAGYEAQTLFPFHRLLESVIRSGQRIINQDEVVEDNLISISIFPIVPHQIVCIIARDLYQTQVQGDEIVKRTQNLIEENLKTVQKIAYLLGENASLMEGELSAIIQSFSLSATKPSKDPHMEPTGLA